MEVIMNNKKQNKVIERSGKFALEHEPIAYQISINMQNMMATYGAETTLNIIKESFYTKQKQQRTNKEVANE